jgi:hypothetical protein
MVLKTYLSPALLLSLVLSFRSLQATPIVVENVGPQIPPNSTNVSLPFLLLGGAGNPDILFFKFKVPNIADVVAINSLVVTIDLADDDDGGGESWHIDFAQPSANLSLMAIGPVNIRPFTTSSPLQLVLPLCACEIDQVLPSMADGNFRIRIQRDSGDFYVVGASVAIDATVPEPATALPLAAGLGLFSVLWRTRSRG